MKKFLLWVAKLVVALALAVALIKFGPLLRGALFGGAPVAVSSTVLSQKLEQMGTLVTLSQTETGEMVSSLSGFLGEWQRVTAPYSFTIQFGVDMQKATVAQGEDGVAVLLPEVEVVSVQFALTGDPVVKDAGYPLTEKRMLEIRRKQEEELIAKYAKDEELLNKAWAEAAARVEGLARELAGADISVAPL